MPKRNYRRSRPRFLLSVLVLLVALGTFLLLLPSQDGTGTCISPVPHVYTLSGTVRDAEIGTISVAGTDGLLYQFDCGGTEFASWEPGALIGCPVFLTYSGVLDPEQASQGAELLRVCVGGPPLRKHISVGAAEDSLSARARSLLSGMSLEEKVGQMFIARCPKGDAAQLAAQYHLGGYILFSSDFKGKNPEQVCQDIAQCQRSSLIPMFIGVDEEGGDVVRVSKYPAFREKPFPSPRELWLSGGQEAVRSDTAEKCGLLRGLGINVNFAPVCDVSQDPEDYIYHRTLGEDAEATAQYVRTVVETMKGSGVASVLKHFPGYGGNADTHTGLAYDNRPMDAFDASDLLPFRAGIAAGTDMVLVSHNIVTAMDSQSPASLSPAVHQILREELGFTGIIVTDDLYMDGVRNFTGDEEAAVLAVQAGNDLLCCTDFQIQVPAVLDAVARGEISEERIDQSVLRILELKLSMGLL